MEFPTPLWRDITIKEAVIEVDYCDFSMIQSDNDNIVFFRIGDFL